MVPSTATAITLVGLSLALGARSTAALSPAPMKECKDKADWSNPKVNNKVKRTCEWLSELPIEKQKKHCSTNRYRNNCPLTCGLAGPKLCTLPSKCCKAITASCLACAAGVTEAEYCEQNLDTVGCKPEPPQCCDAMTASCLACAAGVTEAEYCERNPDTVGCCKPCGTKYAEVTQKRDELLGDRYLSVGGKPLPNFTAPVVAYAHYTHCKAVVDAGEPNPEKATEMDIMHFEHCSVALGKIEIKDGKKMNADACHAAFPHLKVAEQLDELGMGSSDMNDKMAAEYSYGFNYVFFDYGFTYSEVQPQGVDAIVAANFADVLMRRSKCEEKPSKPTVKPIKPAEKEDDNVFKCDLTQLENDFFEIMDGEKAGELNVQARMCQK